MKVRELKEFLRDAEVEDDFEIVIQSIVSGEERYCSETIDISSSVDWNSGEKLLVLVPKEVENIIE